MRPFILIRREEIVENILILELEPKDKDPLRFRPAQFVNLGLQKDGKLVRRPYSIASSPDSRTLEFCIKLVGGEFTSLLKEQKPGAEFMVDGPFGPAFYDESKHFVLIAGGVGIVPMVSILRYRAAREGGQAILFYSARSLSQMPYFQELEELSKKEGIKAVFSLTRETPPGWKYHSGRFGDQTLKMEISTPKEFNYFVCGKKEMVEEMKKLLTSLGAEPSRCHFEGWGV